MQGHSTASSPIEKKVVHQFMVISTWISIRKISLISKDNPAKAGGIKVQRTDMIPALCRTIRIHYFLQPQDTQYYLYRIHIVNVFELLKGSSQIFSRCCT